MISPEVLRRYPYFTAGGEDVLKQIALIADEMEIAVGGALFVEGDAADKLYVITEGEVDIQIALRDGGHATVDTRVAGDLVGWSAVAEVTRRRATATVSKAGKSVFIDGAKLRELCAQNAELDRRLMAEVVRALTQRLDAAWVQLAAAG